MKKKQQLEDKMTDNLPELELYEPMPAMMKYLEEKLNNWTVPELQARIYPFHPLIKGKKVVATDCTGKKHEIELLTRFLQKKSGHAKMELLAFLAFFLGDLRNFRIYLDSLPESVKLLWRRTMDFYYVSHAQFSEETGKKWIQPRDRYSLYSYDVPKSEELVWFGCMRGKTVGKDRFGYKDMDYYFFLPTFLRTHLYPLFFPDDQCKPVPQKELPADRLLHVFKAEADILRELPVLKSLHAQGALEMGKTKMTASTFKKAVKQLNMTEFFPEEADSGYSLMRASLVIPFYAFYQITDHSATDERPENILKGLLEEVIYYPGIFGPGILNHISGLRANVLLDSYIPGQATNILAFLRELNSRDWISVTHLCLDLRKLERLFWYNLLFCNADFEKLDIVNQKLRTEVHLDNCYTQLGIPFIKGFLFMLAAFGLLEIAYTDSKPDDASYYNSLRYVRLTSLGAYVLGLEKKYIAPVAQERTDYFELDDTKLLIRARGEHNPYEPLLDDISSFIGSRRYIVTFASFLKNCATHKDVSDKINFFKQYISSDLPDNWKEFFSTLSRQAAPMTRVTEARYLIYRVNAADKELQRLVSTDPVLRRHVVRAENYLLLVKEGGQKELIARLKEFGYLL